MSDPASALRRIVDVLSTCDVHGWLSYDSLMSVTREGRLDANDPLAVAFLAREAGCVGATVDAFRVARALRRAGMDAEARGEGRCDVAVEIDGSRLSATVQGCWQAGEQVVFAPGLPPRADVDAVLPLGEVVVDGTALPVPADPARVLTAVYGDPWESQPRPFRLRPRAAGIHREDGADLLELAFAVVRGWDTGDVDPAAIDAARSDPAVVADLRELLDLHEGTAEDAAWPDVAADLAGEDIFGLLDGDDFDDETIGDAATPTRVQIKVGSNVEITIEDGTTGAGPGKVSKTLRPGKVS